MSCQVPSYTCFGSGWTVHDEHVGPKHQSSEGEYTTKGSLSSTVIFAGAAAQCCRAVKPAMRYEGKNETERNLIASAKGLVSKARGERVFAQKLGLGPNPLPRYLMEKM